MVSRKLQEGESTVEVIQKKVANAEKLIGPRGETQEMGTPRQPKKDGEPRVAQDVAELKDYVSLNL